MPLKGVERNEREKGGPRTFLAGISGHWPLPFTRTHCPGILRPTKSPLGTYRSYRAGGRLHPLKEARGWQKWTFRSPGHQGQSWGWGWGRWRQTPARPSQSCWGGGAAGRLLLTPQSHLAPLHCLPWGPWVSPDAGGQGLLFAMQGCEAL